MCRSVDKNQLTGSIPPSWRSLHNLYAVNVTSNEGLCGEVPVGIAGVMDYNTTSLNTNCPWTADGELARYKPVTAQHHSPVEQLYMMGVASNSLCLAIMPCDRLQPAV